MGEREIAPESHREENAAGHAPLKNTFSTGGKYRTGEVIDSTGNVNAAAAACAYVL
jgi:hypothetical protein